MMESWNKIAAMDKLEPTRFARIDGVYERKKEAWHDFIYFVLGEVDIYWIEED